MDNAICSPGPTDVPVAAFAMLSASKAANVGKSRLARARALQFYVVKFDDTSVASLSAEGLQAVVSKHRAEAIGMGVYDRPTITSLSRAIQTCGRRGDRCLSYFLW